MESKIINLFSKGDTVYIRNNPCKVLKVGKPISPVGEPKTDLYILLENKNELFELKISLKNVNASFVENKITAQRAYILFGEKWKTILKQSIEQLVNEFNSKKFIFKSSFGKSKEGSFTLVWRFDLVWQHEGKLSGSILLSKEQKLEVYTGENLPSEKKDCFVNSKKIKNSGVANYILISDLQTIKTAEDIFANLLIFDESMVNVLPDIYFSCKALNYRSLLTDRPILKRIEGNRSLVVYVNWIILNNKLHPELIFDDPLEIKGTEVLENLLQNLQLLNIETIYDINRNNVSSVNYIQD